MLDLLANLIAPTRALVTFCAVFLLFPSSQSAQPIEKKRSAREAAAMQFLQSTCVSCHGDEKQKGGLQLTSRESALKGGETGPALKPGKPQESLLVQLLAPEADPHMPPKKQVPEAEIQLLKRWISAGARWDDAAWAKASAPREVKLEAPPATYQPALAIALSADGERLAFGRGGRVVIYDVRATNQVFLREFAAHTDAVRALAWSHEARRLASGSFREVTLWNAETGERVWTATNKLSDRVTALRFAPGDETLLVAEGGAIGGGFVRLLNPATGAEQRSWHAHRDAILSMDLDADGKRLATGGADNLVKIWELSSGKEIAALEGSAGGVMGVAFNDATNEVASASLDHQLKVYDIATRESVVDFPLRNSGLADVAWTKDGRQIIAAREDGTIWSFTDIKRHTGAQSSDTGNQRQLYNCGETAQCLVMDEANARIFVAGESGGVYVVSFEGKALATLQAPQAREWRDRETPAPSFVRDVLPAMAKAGCMAGACHAKAEGQNGFKLSVFSYDPKDDFREIVKEGRGRRVFPAAAEESLLLLKPTAAISHGGGKRLDPGSEAYKLIADWIRGGMVYQHTNEPALLAVHVEPKAATYRPGQSRKLKVQAEYSDGSFRDVTHLADFVSNEKEIASVSEQGVVRAEKTTGESVIVARYMGFVDGSRVTIPASKKLPEKQYATLPVHNFIDELAYAKFRELGLFPSELAGDAEFLRRVSLDIIGVLPTPEEAEAFLADPSPDKRGRWIERLLEHPGYADYWANKWADLLRPNPDRVGVKSVFTLDQWLRDAFRRNIPYDQFARAFVLLEGSNHRDGPAVVYRDRREPPELATMFSQIFLGTRMECAKCHHHPTEKWSQEDFYQFAAYFGAVKQKGAGLSPPISAGTETFYFKPGGTVKHPVSGEVMKPRPLSAEPSAATDQEDPREGLAKWMTNPSNPFFAKAAVNRVWANFFGRGIVEPVDDFRLSNPPSNEPLLDALARDFAANGYDFKRLIRTITHSRLYQLSSSPNEHNLHDTRNFSRAYRRRLPAEALLDAVNDVTGVPDTYNGCPPGTRAVQTWSYKVASQFMDAFSRPNPSSDPPCERETKLSVVQALHMMNSRALQSKLSNPSGRARILAASGKSPEEIVRELYLRALSRPPKPEELAAAAAVFESNPKREEAAEDVLWALLNSPEFVFNH